MHASQHERDDRLVHGGIPEALGPAGEGGR